MTDKEQIERLYHEMYAAMVKKDRAQLERIHDDSFVLVHMTGMRQSKSSYISSIMDRTLNYYSEKTEGLEIAIDGDRATMTGRSRVNAAVFGGGRHTWPLELRFQLVRRDDGWKLTEARVTTY